MREKQEKNEMNEFMLKDAMKDCKLDSGRKDAIWEQIRAKRSEYSTRGSRRHLEKIIVGYISVALAFTLTITVGAGLWSQMTEEDQSDNPSGVRLTENSGVGSAPGENTPAIIGTKSIWADKEGVEDFVELLNTEKGWENEPMNKLEDFRDTLNYQFNTSYSADNILRIHSSDLEGQDAYQIYQQYGQKPGEEVKSWVLYQGENIYPLMVWYPRDVTLEKPSIGTPQQDIELYHIWSPLAFFDFTLEDPRGDGSRDLLIIANSMQLSFCVNWRSDNTKNYICKWYQNAQYDECEVCIYAFNIDNGLNTIKRHDFEASEYDQSFCVFNNGDDNDRKINVMYANPSPKMGRTVTGEFSYECSIEERRYGMLLYGGNDGGEDWAFIETADIPPETLPSVTTNPPVNTRPSADEADAVTDSGLLLCLNESGDSYYVLSVGSCTDSNIVIPESWDGLPITKIGEKAFIRCQTLISITVPEGVTEICDRAFFECWNLMDVSLPNSLRIIGEYAFAGCSGFKDFTIPDGVTTLGYLSFWNCIELISITIPESVTEIDGNVFRECQSLYIFNVAEGNPNYHSTGNCLIQTKEKRLISGNYNTIIPTDGSIAEIGPYAYANLYAPVKRYITIPDSVKVIREFAFYNYRLLYEITMSEGVTIIEDGAFGSCQNLRGVFIPKSVTKIRAGAFDNCDKLTDIYYAGTEAEWNSIQIIGIIGITVHYEATELPPLQEEETPIKPPADEFEIEGGLFLRPNESGDSYYVSSFGNCTDSHIVIPSSWNGLPITKIGNGAFSKCDLTSVVIPDSITEIEGAAFANCKNLKSIIIPDSVTAIGTSIFWGSTALTNVTLSKKLTKIPESAFWGCTALTEITIPDGVTQIIFLSFHDCTNLKSVTIPESVTLICFGSFWNCESLTDVYYTGSQKGWKAIPIDNYNEWLTSATIHFAKDDWETPDPTEPEVPKEVETEQGLLLRLSDSGDYYNVVGIGSCKDTDLVIPASYNGLPIYIIAPNAFDNCEGLVSVTISEGIFEIGSGAFQKIDSLISVTIPSSVGTVGNNAFLGCVNLQNVTIAEGVLRYGAEAFFGCRSLKTITIPKGAEFIGEWIFDGCDSLTDVYFGGSKAEWEYAAFDVMPPDHATLHFAE